MSVTTAPQATSRILLTSAVAADITEGRSIARGLWLRSAFQLVGGAGSDGVCARNKGTAAILAFEEVDHIHFREGRAGEQGQQGGLGKAEREHCCE